MKELVEERVGEWVDRWMGWVIGAVVAVALVVLVVTCVVAFNYVTSPLPTCPPGFVLAGGGYGGRYHCIPGAEPIR